MTPSTTQNSAAIADPQDLAMITTATEARIDSRLLLALRTETMLEVGQ